METQKVLQYSTPPLTNIRAARENPERAVSATSPVIVFRNGQGQAEMRLRGAGSLARATRLHEEVFASRNQGLQKASLCKAIATDGTSDDPHAPD